jgi:ribosomal protein S18 acetylase RimI-like enzyme
MMLFYRRYQVRDNLQWAEYIRARESYLKTEAESYTKRIVMNLHIRPVGDHDVEDLVQLSLLAWAPVFSSFEHILGSEIYPIIYPDWRTSQRAAVETVCKDGEKTSVWVAEVNGLVVGFLAYELNVKDKSAEVQLLAVHPDYQNRGIGTALNTFALKKMQESGMKLAVVGTGGDTSHAPARKSYEKAGYTALPLVRYYKDL